MEHYKLSLFVILLSVSCCLSNSIGDHKPVGSCDEVDPSGVAAIEVAGDCTGYTLCSGGSQTSHKCPNGLWFEPDRQMCAFPGPYCLGGDVLTAEVSLKALGPDPRCVDSGTHYWPHAKYCNRYIECYLGYSYENSCPAGLYFSELYQRCGEPAQSECCQISDQC